MWERKKGSEQWTLLWLGAVILFAAALAGCAHADRPATSPQSSAGSENYAKAYKQVNDLAMSLHEFPPPGYAGAWREYPDTAKGRISKRGTYALIVAFKGGDPGVQRQAVLARVNADFHSHIYFHNATRDKQEQDAGLERIKEALAPLHKGKAMGIITGYNVKYDRFEVGVFSEASIEEAQRAIPDDLKTDTIVYLDEPIIVG